MKDNLSTKQENSSIKPAIYNQERLYSIYNGLTAKIILAGNPHGGPLYTWGLPRGFLGAFCWDKFYSPPIMQNKYIGIIEKMEEMV